MSRAKRRTAVIAVLVFLARNGYIVRNNEQESGLSSADKKLMNLALDIAAGHIRSVGRVTRCLKKHTKLVPRQEVRTAKLSVVSSIARLLDQVSRQR